MELPYELVRMVLIMLWTITFLGLAGMLCLAACRLEVPQAVTVITSVGVGAIAGILTPGVRTQDAIKPKDQP